MKGNVVPLFIPSSFSFSFWDLDIMMILYSQVPIRSIEEPIAVIGIILNQQIPNYVLSK